MKIGEEEWNRQWEAWVETRPPAVRAVARKFPIGTRFLMHGKVVHVISYEENGGISVSETDPCKDYKTAVDSRQPVCPCCVEKLEEMKL